MALTATDLDAITKPMISGTVADNIFKKTPTLSRLWAKKRRFTGGTNVRHPLEYAVNTTATAFTGTNARDIQNPTFLTDARVELKEYYVGLTISDRQRSQNSGPEAVVSLMDAAIDNAAKSLNKVLEEDIWDTSATEPNTQTIEGFKDILSTSTTYANVAVADFAGWAAQIDSSTTALSIAALVNHFEDVASEGEVPTVCHTTHPVYAKLVTLLQAQQRFMTADSANVGFKTLEFLGIPVFKSAYVPGTGSGTADSYFVMLNENYLYLYVSDEFNGDLGKWKDMKPREPIFANSGELKTAFICSNRRMQGAMTTINPAS